LTGRDKGLGVAVPLLNDDIVCGVDGGCFCFHDSR
jgi:hypothetical protein